MKCKECGSEDGWHMTGCDGIIGDLEREIEALKKENAELRGSLAYSESPKTIYDWKHKSLAYVIEHWDTFTPGAKLGAIASIEKLIQPILQSVTRLVVVETPGGRTVDRVGLDIELQIQDEGRTLKVFAKRKLVPLERGSLAYSKTGSAEENNACEGGFGDGSLWSEPKT